MRERCGVPGGAALEKIAERAHRSGENPARSSVRLPTQPPAHRNQVARRRPPPGAAERARLAPRPPGPPGAARPGRHRRRLRGCFRCRTHRRQSPPRAIQLAQSIGVASLRLNWPSPTSDLTGTVETCLTHASSMSHSRQIAVSSLSVCLPVCRSLSVCLSVCLYLPLSLCRCLSHMGFGAAAS